MTKDQIIALLLEAVKENHKHHKEYGSDYGYEGSYLYDQNEAAIKAAESPTLTQDDILKQEIATAMKEVQA